jgi:circadian clock protein KaiC
VTRRLPSGQPHLDLILGGGLPADAINLVIGLPGSGKTMLAEQYVFTNATEARPALYFTTASEPLEKVIRYGQGLSFFDASKIGSALFYDDLGPTLHASGLPAALERIVAALRDHRPGFLVIDSFKALETYASDALEFRRFVIELAGRLSALPISTFWVGEYHVDEVPHRPEFAIADTIIALASERSGDRTVRSLQVTKERGSDFLSGSHAYRLSADGLRVFPRLADAPIQAAYELDGRRLSTGVPDLDEMLGGGLWPGSTTLLAGPSGSGKTLTALHFLRAGAEDGHPGVFASLQENPSQIGRVAAGYGWDLAASGIELMYRSPVDVYLDEWVYELLDTIERSGSRRVAIDSLSDLRMTSPDEVRFHEYIYSLIQRCSKLGITVLMTHEVHDLFGATAILGSDVSHLADNLVLLRYDLRHDAVEREMIALKTRGSRHDPHVRHFTIGDDGIVFGPVSETVLA